MLHQQYQPKDAQIKPDHHVDDDTDDESLTSSKTTTASKITPRKTHAQELADFLKSTGPEEFEKELSPKSRNAGGVNGSSSGSNNTLFFMRRKNKPPISKQKEQKKKLSPPFPQQQQQQPLKRHIEIIPPPYDCYQEPILPSKKRESSLFSGSVRHYHTNNSNSNSSYSTQPSSVAKHHPVVSDVFQNNNKHIDQALKERIASFLASSSPEAVATLPPLPPIPKPAAHIQARHVQTQTEPNNIPPLLLLPPSPMNNNKSKRHYSGPADSPIPPSSINNVEELQRLIALEKAKQKRLEIAMETTCDQFEVVSGLTYIKLRSLWEEKLHWESAFYALQERCYEQQ